MEEGEREGEGGGYCGDIPVIPEGGGRSVVKW